MCIQKVCAVPLKCAPSSKKNDRLRLVAGDNSDIPRNLHNIVVSIHPIVTFQALHDYLRPRVAGLLSSSRLSGMFAALAASGFVGSTSKPPASSSLRVGDLILDE
jgi:E3 ubiquitin-protein ligase TRIP12